MQMSRRLANFNFKTMVSDILEERNKENRASPCPMTNETDGCLTSRLSNTVQTANFFVHVNCKVILDVQAIVYLDKFL